MSMPELILYLHFRMMGSELRPYGTIKSVYYYYYYYYYYYAKLLMPISLPELVQSILELIHRCSIHNILR